MKENDTHTHIPFKNVRRGWGGVWANYQLKGPFYKDITWLRGAITDTIMLVVLPTSKIAYKIPQVSD